LVFGETKFGIKFSLSDRVKVVIGEKQPNNKQKQIPSDVETNSRQKQNLQFGHFPNSFLIRRRASSASSTCVDAVT
jgi:hypothetical protein